MRRRLEKEIRPLLLPWAIALGAAIYLGVGLSVYTDTPASTSMLLAIYQFSCGASPFVLVGALVIASGLSFGAEFHYRTLPVLVSQPVPRVQIWKDKMVALTAIAGSGGLFACVAAFAGSWLFSKWYPNEAPPTRELAQLLLFNGLLLVTTVCGSTFWSLVSRSTIGGLILNLASQVAIICVTSLVVNRWFNEDKNVFRAAVVTAGFIYSGMFLWLGRRRFCSMEFTGDYAAEVGPKLESLARFNFNLGLLRCRAVSPVINLVRKEVRLNKPSFLLSAVFILCWILSVALRFVVPAFRENFEVILNTATVIYIAVLLLLGGCISFGEEKALGLSNWNLTLPIAGRTQWLVKLLVGLTLMLLLGFVLPLLVSSATEPLAKVGVYGFITAPGQWAEKGIPFILCSLLFLATFWASTLVNSTVSAALTGFLTVCGLGGCTALAIWCFQGWVDQDGRQILYLLISKFHISQKVLTGITEEHLFALATAVIAGTLLLQSSVQFRRTHSQVRKLFGSAATLIVVAFTVVFLSVSVYAAANQIRLSPLLDLQTVVRMLPAPAENPTHEHPRILTLEEIERSVSLGRVTKDYLKDKQITIELVPRERPKDKLLFSGTIRSSVTKEVINQFFFEIPARTAPGAKLNAPTNNPIPVGP